LAIHEFKNYAWDFAAQMNGTATEKILHDFVVIQDRANIILKSQLKLYRKAELITEKLEKMFGEGWSVFKKCDKMEISETEYEEIARYLANREE